MPTEIELQTNEMLEWFETQKLLYAADSRDQKKLYILPYHYIDPPLPRCAAYCVIWGLQQIITHNAKTAMQAYLYGLETVSSHCDIHEVPES